MPATLKDVATLANVSRATACLALNGKEVNEDTRKKVLEAAKKLNYYKSSIARNLITGKSNTIGLYILNSDKSPNLTEECSYFYLLIKGVIAEIEKHGYTFNFEEGNWNDVLENGFIVKKAYSRSIDGMVIIPQYVYQYSFIPELEKVKFPYVIVNPSSPVNGKNSIVVDNSKGVALAVEYFHSVGIKNVGFVNGPKNHYDAVVREKSFIENILRYGMSLHNGCIYYGDFTIEGGYGAAREMISKGHVPQAIFCANDYMAAGAMCALREKGLEIPKDVSIIGFDDIDVSRAVYPALTTLNYSIFEVGKSAASRLLQLINGENVGNSALSIATKLMVRDSCVRGLAGNDT